jgi:RNA polymerase sigma-70 factor, ECF subfamily
MDMQGAKSARKGASSGGLTGPEPGTASKGSGRDSGDFRRAASDRSDPISSGLRKLWDDVALEPVPDDFLSLLDRIQTERDAPEASAGRRSGGGLAMSSLSRADEAAFRGDLVAIIPSLRAFARGLCGNRELADDLSQEALAKAWAARGSYQPGTNFRAWMYRILRNHFYTTAAVAKRFVPYDPDLSAHVQTTPPNQGGELTLADLQRGLATLTAEQREALILLESGMQWDEIADVMGCPLGTVKSRITRGRAALKLYMDGPSDVPDLPGPNRPPTRPQADGSGAPAIS